MGAFPDMTREMQATLKTAATQAWRDFLHSGGQSGVNLHTLTDHKETLDLIDNPNLRKQAGAGEQVMVVVSIVMRKVGG